MDYDEQLSAAKFRAERDQARQECERLRARLRDAVPREAYERKRAAWLRQIRECETALHRRREHIKRLENAALERRTVRAEDREAAEWVREHGGLDSVKKLLDWVVGHCSTKQQLDFNFWLSGRVMHELGFEEDMADRDEVERRLLARLMPEGMEWPRYESGELVRSGDRMIDDNGDRFSAVSFIFTCDWWCIEGYQQTGFGTLSRENKRKLSGMPYSARVKRPAPKALDADGVEVHKGDDVWSTTGEFDGKRTVSSVHIDPGEPPYAMFEERQKPYSCLCCCLTHRAPVIAADRKPLREGQTVWGVDSGTRYTVEEITDELIPIKCRSEMGSTAALYPSQLTHAKPEPPDTWERLEEDAEKDPCGYFGFDGEEICGKCPASGKNCEQTMARDLVRRCRALAERGK